MKRLRKRICILFTFLQADRRAQVDRSHYHTAQRLYIGWADADPQERLHHSGRPGKQDPGDRLCIRGVQYKNTVLYCRVSDCC